MLESIIKDTATVQTLLICLIAAMILGILNAAVFLHHSRHSSGFALTLALLPMSVAVIIMMVNGNVGTGVAVAGAFALIRFRSVPGTAREIAAIFTSMGLGLALGMGYVGIAVIFFIFTAFFTTALTMSGFGGKSRCEKSLKITIPENYDYNGLFDDIFAKYTDSAELSRIKTTNMGTLYELTYDVRFKSETVPKECVDELRTRNGNLNVIIGDFSEKDML